jgi:hypothetical protein
MGPGAGGSTVLTESEHHGLLDLRLSLLLLIGLILPRSISYIFPFREVAMLRTLMFSALYHPSGSGGVLGFESRWREECQNSNSLNSFFLLRFSVLNSR